MPQPKRPFYIKLRIMMNQEHTRSDMKRRQDTTARAWQTPSYSRFSAAHNTNTGAGGTVDDGATMKSTAAAS